MDERIFMKIFIENSKKSIFSEDIQDNRWGDVDVLSMKKNGSGLKRMRMIKWRRVEGN